MPSDAQKPPIGGGPRERIWGMIATNYDQPETAREGMYFQDSDRDRGWTGGLGPDHIVGYVHGMIQAIYDVAARDKGQGGTPYEIAVGDMLALTDHAGAPWHLVPADNKRHARLEILKISCKQIAAAAIVTIGTLAARHKSDVFVVQNGQRRIAVVIECGHPRQVIGGQVR